MTSITCGKCGSTHGSVYEVRHCYGKVTPAPSSKPMALVTVPTKVPESKYALANLPGHSNDLTFFEVQYGKKNTKWDGFQFVNRLVGAPGDFRKFPVKGAAKAIVLSKIADDPKAAAKTFSQEFTVCAACGAPLTDDESRAQGFGPVCITRF